VSHTTLVGANIVVKDEVLRQTTLFLSHVHYGKNYHNLYRQAKLYSFCIIFQYSVLYKMQSNIDLSLLFTYISAHLHKNKKILLKHY